VPSLPRRPVFATLTVLLGLGLVVAGVGWSRARGPVVRVVTPTVRDLEQHLVASGRVRVPERIGIATRQAGQVTAVAAVAGQRVTAGEVLVQLDDAELRNAVQQAETARAQAVARVEQLRRVGSIEATEALREAETRLARAEAELARTERLAASGAVPENDLTEARREVELARARRTVAFAQQAAATPAGAASRLVLTAQLQAEAQLAGAALRLEQARIVAPAAGLVLSREVERGDVVPAGRVLLTLAADADVELVFFPDERNLARLELGQPARASADAWPETVFDATVSYIAPAVDPARGSVEVRLRVPTPPPGLKPDMTVSIDVTVARRPGALTVPSEALADPRASRTTALVVVDGRLAERAVRLGLRGDGATEVQEGLTPTDRVVLPAARPLRPGDAVRVTAD
jgi:HlyD family secretion protein